MYYIEEGIGEARWEKGIERGQKVIGLTTSPQRPPRQKKPFYTFNIS
jgi:hypothetical protein